MKRCFVCCSNGEAPPAADVEMMTAIASSRTLGLGLETTSSLGSEPREETEEDPASHEHVVLQQSEESPCKEEVTEVITEQVTTAFTSSRVTTVPSLEDQDILRATSVRNILSKGGSILKSSVGSADTYCLSKPRQWIDIFISHNWSVPRWKKFWALALYINIWHAVVVSYACVAIGYLMNLLQVPPAFEQYGTGMRPWCLVVGSVGFWIALMFGHDLPLMERVCCPRQVFLDKICIHQTDPKLKAAGINHLGSFLRYSEKMLVLFNVVYCKRLWTVYEVACYMYLHRKEKLEMLPVDIASVVLKSTALITLVHWILRVNTHIAVMLGLGALEPTLLVGVLIFTLIFVLAFILRKWALQQSELLSDLQAFQIAKAHCAEESDRALVSNNICAFVHSMGLVKDGATDTDALNAFDKLVQERLPELLRRAVGYVGFPYRYALVAGMGHDFYTFDVLSSRTDFTPLEVGAHLVDNFVVRAAVLPSMFLVCAIMGKACKHRRGWAEVGVKLGIGATASLVTGALICGSLAGAQFAKRSVWYLLAYLAIGLALTLVVIKLFAYKGRAAAPASPLATCKQTRESWGAYARNSGTNLGQQ